MRQYQIDNLIAVLSSFVIVVTVTIVVLRLWRRTFEAKHELRRQLLDKMTSEEAVRLLESADGRRSIAALVGEGEERGVVGAMGRGATLVLIGLALGGSAALSRLPLVGTAGLIAVAAGLGQMVTAWLIARELRK
jgi:hypothetical protein